MGMGNTTVAVTTDRTAIFHNPAGLGLLQDKVDISLTPIMLSVDGKFITLINALNKEGKKLSDISQIDKEFIDTINALDGYWMGVEYMPQLTIAKKNIGFGVYSVWPVNLRIESGHFIPKIGIRGERDLVFTWAVGVPLKHENNLFGISLDYVQRTPVEETITKYTETFSLVNNLSSNPASMLGLLGDYANVKHGTDFNVGFMHNLGGFRIAWDVKDIFGVIGGDLVFPPQFDVGCAYFFPEVTEKLEFMRSLIVAAQITDLIGFEPTTGRYEQFAKKIHMGAEVDIKYLALRGGLSQGYPTAGVGLYLGPLSLDYVYFTKETGYFAGQLPQNMHVLAISFGLRVEGNKARQVLGTPSEGTLAER
jgi:hypothetical protein